LFYSEQKRRLKAEKKAKEKEAKLAEQKVNMTPWLGCFTYLAVVIW
jgi:hypothetical protein